MVVILPGHWVDKKGKILTGNHRLSHQMWDFPVIFPLNQSIDSMILKMNQLLNWEAVEQLLGLWRLMVDISMANLCLKRVKKKKKTDARSRSREKFPKIPQYFRV